MTQAADNSVKQSSKPREFGESSERSIDTDKASIKLSKDAPEVNASNLNAALKLNHNKLDTFSPDGKSRFCLSENEKTSDPWQKRKEIIAQSIPSKISRNDEINAAQIFTGEAQATIKFALNSLAGAGELIRMAAAAHREGHPALSLLPDSDPDATKKFHDTCAGLSAAARIMLQYDTTFNPASPLYRKVFDPEAAQMAKELALGLPANLKNDLDNFQKLDRARKAEKGTEIALNILALAQGEGRPTYRRCGRRAVIEAKDEGAMIDDRVR